MKLTFYQRVMNLLGWKYIANNRTKEIHRIEKKHINCHLDLLTDFTYLTETKMNKLLSNGYNGCRWCFKEKDKDINCVLSGKIKSVTNINL